MPQTPIAPAPRARVIFDPETGTFMPADDPTSVEVDPEAAQGAQPQGRTLLAPPGTSPENARANPQTWPGDLGGKELVQGMGGFGLDLASLVASIAMKRLPTRALTGTALTGAADVVRGDDPTLDMGMNLGGEFVSEGAAKMIPRFATKFGLALGGVHDPDNVAVNAFLRQRQRMKDAGTTVAKIPSVLEKTDDLAVRAGAVNPDYGVKHVGRFGRRVPGRGLAPGQFTQADAMRGEVERKLIELEKSVLEDVPLKGVINHRDWTKGIVKDARDKAAFPADVIDPVRERQNAFVTQQADNAFGAGTPQAPPPGPGKAPPKAPKKGADGVDIWNTPDREVKLRKGRAPDPAPHMSRSNQTDMGLDAQRWGANDLGNRVRDLRAGMARSGRGAGSITDAMDAPDVLHDKELANYLNEIRVSLARRSPNPHTGAPIDLDAADSELNDLLTILEANTGVRGGGGTITDLGGFGMRGGAGYGTTSSVASLVGANPSKWGSIGGLLAQVGLTPEKITRTGFVAGDLAKQAPAAVKGGLLASEYGPSDEDLAKFDPLAELKAKLDMRRRRP